MEQITIDRQNFSCSPSRDSPRPSLMGRQAEVKQRSVVEGTEPRPCVVFRRLSGRLGSDNQRPTVLRSLVHSGEKAAHKQFGTESHMECPERSRTSSFKQGSVCLLRQHHGPGLSCETRRDKIPRSISACETDFVLGGGEECLSHPTIYQRGQECHGGLPQQKRAGSSNRMDVDFCGVSTTLEDLGPTYGRPVCLQVDSSVTNVHVSSSRSGSFCRGLHVATLVQHGRLCFPSFCYVKRRDEQVQTILELSDDTLCSMVASKGIVSRPGRPSGRCAKTVTTQTGPASATSGKTAPSKPPLSSVDGLETCHPFWKSKTAFKRGVV